MQQKFSGKDSPLWVVTSYFNPSKYRRRYENFQIFRKFLNVPLLVVELERNGDFQLTETDGDHVIQLTGEDRIWQKERLLNIGIAALPDHVEYVAWIDCDVILGGEDWPSLAIAHLEKDGGMVQPFSEARHLTRAATETSKTYNQFMAAESFFSQTAFALLEQDRDTYFAARMSERESDGKSPGAAPPKAKVSTGLAWAARRHELQKFGLYDRNVLGSGDTVLLCTAQGWLEALLADEHFGSCIEAHVFEWATSVQQSFSTSVAALPNKLIHLWHGEFINRRYRNRHKILLDNNYDPERDVRLASNGTLEWSSPESQLAKDVARYFAARQEDG